MRNKSRRRAAPRASDAPDVFRMHDGGGDPMPRKLTFRQILLSILALWYDRSWKEVGAPAGIPGKQVSQHLRRGPLSERAYELLLRGLPSPPGAVEVVTSCIEGLEALETENGLSPEEKAEIERAVLRGGL